MNPASPLPKQEPVARRCHPRVAVAAPIPHPHRGAPSPPSSSRSPSPSTATAEVSVASRRCRRLLRRHSLPSSPRSPSLEASSQARRPPPPDSLGSAPTGFGVGARPLPPPCGLWPRTASASVPWVVVEAVIAKVAVASRRRQPLHDRRRALAREEGREKRKREKKRRKKG